MNLKKIFTLGFVILFSIASASNANEINGEMLRAGIISDENTTTSTEDSLNYSSTSEESAKAKKNDTLRTGIAAYKAADYTGCLQNMLEVIADDPSNVMAHYYAGMSNIQLGNMDKGMLAYKKVVILNTNPKLTQLAIKGIEVLENPEGRVLANYKTPIDRSVEYLYGENKYTTVEVDREMKTIDINMLKHDSNQRAEEEVKRIKEEEAKAKAKAEEEKKN